MFILGICFSKYKDLDRFSYNINHLDTAKMRKFAGKNYI